MRTRVLCAVLLGLLAASAVQAEETKKVAKWEVGPITTINGRYCILVGNRQTHQTGMLWATFVQAGKTVEAYGVDTPEKLQGLPIDRKVEGFETWNVFVDLVEESAAPAPEEGKESGTSVPAPPAIKRPLPRRPAVIKNLESETTNGPATRASCLWTNFGCMAEIQQMLKRGERIAGSDDQGPLINLFYQTGLPQLSLVPGLRHFAGTTESVNKELEKAGFKVRLQGATAFAVASVMKFHPEWLQKGRPTFIPIEGNEYAAVHVAGAGINVVRVIGRKEPVAVLATKDGRYALLTKVAEDDNVIDIDTFSIRLARSIAESERMSEYPGGVVFPRTVVDTILAQDQLKGISGLGKDGKPVLGRDGKPVVVAESVQQIQLTLDEAGSAATSASNLGDNRGGSTPAIHYLDGPFVAIITDPNLALPISAAVCTADNWEIKK